MTADYKMCDWAKIISNGTLRTIMVRAVALDTFKTVSADTI